MRNKLSIFICLLIAILSLTHGCDKNSSGSYDGPLIPLDKISRWDGEVCYDGYECRDDDEWIVRDSTFEGEIWYSIIDNEIDPGFSQYWACNLPDGYYISSGLGYSSELGYKYPASVGDSYNIQDGSVLMEVISTDSIIIVPAGIFECYVYKKHGEWVTICFIAPGVGKVRMDFYDNRLDNPDNLILYGTYELHSITRN